MNKIILHIKIWNQWRKNNLNSKLYKFLVLIGWLKSPTMLGYYIDFGVREGLKELEDRINDK